jgi:hypothetical protein
MRHLEGSNDGAFLFGRTVNECGVGESLGSRDRGDEKAAGNDLGGFHLLVPATAIPLGPRSRSVPPKTAMIP